MKVGDLVAYVEADRSDSGPIVGQEGLILSGPKTGREEYGLLWEVYWMYCSKIGWWEEFRLEVISESR